MIEQKRPTVGAIASDLLTKTPETRNPIDLEREMQKEYMQELIDCVMSWRAKFDTKDFYVTVITKNEKLMPNVFRNYFVPRFSCPTPDYDQTVFKYHAANEDIEYIWSIPSKDACIHLLANANQVHKNEQQLLGFIKDFASGKLYKLAKVMNGEEELSSLLQV